MMTKTTSLKLLVNWNCKRLCFFGLEKQALELYVKPIEPVVPEPAEEPEFGNPLSAFVGMTCKFFGVNPPTQQEIEDFCGQVPRSFESVVRDIHPSELANIVSEFSGAVGQRVTDLKVEIEKKFERAVKSEQVSQEVPLVSEEVPLPSEQVPLLSEDERQEVAHNAICDSCDCSIRGIRYKCLHCPDYDLCSACEAGNANGEIHDSEHIFAKLYKAPKREMRCLRGGKGRGKCGGPRQRLGKLENDIQELKQQVAELVALRSKPEEVVAEAPSVEFEEIEELIEEFEDVQQPEPVDLAQNDSLETLRMMGFSADALTLAEQLLQQHPLAEVVELLLQ